MKKYLFSFIILSLIASISLFGFSCGKTTDDAYTEPADQSLTKILAKAERPTELSYDMQITGADGTIVTTTVYIKGTKIRQESNIGGQKVIMLGDTEGIMYTYYPVQNMAVKMDFQESMESGEIEKDPFEVLDELMETVTVLGYEYIGEKRCVVVEYKMDNFTQKMWIWERYGMPIKIETTTDQGISKIEYLNIETHDIDDTLFILPEGVTVTDLSQMMQGDFDPTMFEGFGQ